MNKIEPTLLKGAKTRYTLIQDARDILNRLGIGITIEAIAREMGVSKSRISNHFPTKDSLFIAILNEYETELARLFELLVAEGFHQTLQGYVDGLSRVMDIQFKYRCGIIYLNVLSPSQHELKAHIAHNYQRNLTAIKSRMQLFLQQGIIEPKVLDEPDWSAFVFVYVNVLTQWVIHADMYNSEKSYEENKHVYIRGILQHLYLPYLTEKGKAQLHAINY